MELDRLRAILHEYYGLDAPHIEPAPRGFVAETYRVRGAGADYFAKIIKFSRYSAFLKTSLPILRELHRLGMTQLTTPVPARDGRLAIEVDGHVVALFEWIDEDADADYPFDEYAALIGQIHALFLRVRVVPPIENFRPLIVPIYEKAWATIFDGLRTHPAEIELVEIMGRVRAELEADWVSFHKLMRELQGPRVPLVITHGDAPGNVLMDKAGGLHLIDWDDVLAAPPERDTWFHLVEPERAARFLAAYRQHNPKYEPDERLIRYYLLLRYFEDLEGLYAKVMDATASDESRFYWLAWIERDCFTWLRPPVRRFFPFEG